jgi:hypothetical protein
VTIEGRIDWVFSEGVRCGARVIVLDLFSRLLVKRSSEDEQAAWLERVYDLIKKHPRVEKLFWAFYRDTDAMFKDATDYLGIVRKDLSPKPSFFSMKKLISRHAGHG